MTDEKLIEEIIYKIIEEKGAEYALSVLAGNLESLAIVMVGGDAEAAGASILIRGIKGLNRDITIHEGVPLQLRTLQ